MKRREKKYLNRKKFIKRITITPKYYDFASDPIFPQIDKMGIQINGSFEDLVKELVTPKKDKE